MRQTIAKSDLGYSSPPGGFLMDELEAAGLGFGDLVTALGEGAPTGVEQLLSGEWRLTEAAAKKISSLLGSPARTWLRFEENYRNALRAGRPIVRRSPSETRASTPNGKVALRLPIGIHERAIEKAHSEGVSLNTLLLGYVTKGLGKSKGKSSP
jgi:plasmid maintenance system antidote protein VapI